MKTKLMKRTTRLLAFMLLLLVSISGSMAAEGNTLSLKSKKAKQEIDTLKYDVYKGKIVDQATKDPLIFATIAVKGVNVATVSNSDGEFLLKIAKDLDADKLLISYIGYKNREVSVSTLKSRKNIIGLEVAAIPLEEVNIRPEDPVALIKSLLKRIAENYSMQPNMMQGFYRETVKKNRNYVAVSEAIVDIYKASYAQLKDDQVQINKGRKSSDVKKMDTLLFKLQGGPYTSLLMDVIKNPLTLLSEDFLNNYNYKLTNITKINNKLHYVIDFEQKPDVDYPLYFGSLYIETGNLALSSARFSLNLENEEEASRIFIRKKPAGVKLTPLSANYLVNYREQNGKWFFTYARGEVKFKCNWKRRWFNTNYSAMSEIAITDRHEDKVVQFKPKERFKARDIFVEEVHGFADENFWGAYNTIEPDQSIEAAIRKLKRKASR